MLLQYRKKQQNVPVISDITGAIVGVIEQW